VIVKVRFTVSIKAVGEAHDVLPLIRDVVIIAVATLTHDERALF
jgi:hypothetical protein